jgi:type VI secretion system secreted protein Hcp
MALGDMFLKIEGTKQGAIKGESKDSSHKEEIDVLGWSWGMESNISLQSGLAAAKTSMSELIVVKRVDKASTALMASLRNNEVLKNVTLTVRKAGKTPLEYYKVVLQDSRLTSIKQQNGETEGAPDCSESISLSFKKVTVEYTPQGDDGLPQGATTFEAEL